MEFNCTQLFLTSLDNSQISYDSYLISPDASQWRKQFDELPFAHSDQYQLIRERDSELGSGYKRTDDRYHDPNQAVWVAPAVRQRSIFRIRKYMKTYVR